MSFPGGSEGQASACNAGDRGSIPELGRSSGEGNGNPLQYSCLETLMDGGAWEAAVHGVAKSWTRLSDFTSLTGRHCPGTGNSTMGKRRTQSLFPWHSQLSGNQTINLEVCITAHSFCALKERTWF